MKEIAAALIEAQKELPLVIGKTTKGHYRDFAGLETLIEKVRPILSKNGIAVLQAGAMVDGKFSCRTLLLHTSGEFIEGYWPVEEAKDAKLHPAQAVGQGWSYARRYSLPAILCIGTGEQDLDASEPPKEEQRQAQQKLPIKEEQPEQEPTFREWFDGQIAYLRTALGDDFDAEVKRRGVGDLSELKTAGDAKALIDGLKNSVDNRAAGGGE